MAREDEIRIIAYNIWEEEGCVNGRDCEHWYRAEIIWKQQQNEKPLAKATAQKPRKVAEGKTRSTAPKKSKKT